MWITSRVRLMVLLRMLSLWRVQDYCSLFINSLILHVLFSILVQYVMGNYACSCSPESWYFLCCCASGLECCSYKQTELFCIFSSTQRKSLARQKRLSWMPTWRTWLHERTAPKTGPKRSSDRPRCCFNPTQVRIYTGVTRFESVQASDLH